MSNDTHHQFLERKRSLLMSRLLRTIDEIDNRRHAVEDVAVEAKDKAPPVAAAAAGVGVVVLATLAVLNRRKRKRDMRSPLRRVARLVARYTQPAPPPLLAQTASKVATSLLVSAAGEALRVGLRRWLTAKTVGERTAATPAA